MTKQEIQQNAFKKALEAECLWANELKSVYGKEYQNARYDSKRNHATPKLNRLYEDFLQAGMLLHNLTVRK